MRKFIILGSVVVVLMGFLTAAPVTTGNYRSDAFTLTSSHEAASLGHCADLKVAGDVMAEIRRPLIDLWGVASVHDVSVGNVEVSTQPRDTCAGAVNSSHELTAMSTFVLLSNPTCPEPNVVEENEQSIEEDGVFWRCGGRAVWLESVNQAPEGEVHARTGWGYDLGSDASFTRAHQWCLDVATTVDFYVNGNSSDTSAAQYSTSDACLTVQADGE